MENNKPLRSGFTTGTCAAACAGAAVFMLLSGRTAAAAGCILPSGREVRFRLEMAQRGKKSAMCGIKKDAGDDPDVTNGTLILAEAFLTGVSPENGMETEETGSSEEKTFCYRDRDFPGILVTGGPGVGVVTRKGLSCPPGYPAINPTPRRMIMREADRARRAAGYPEAGLRIEISVPEGGRLAQHTFNPNLGIQGGISILGTTGIVNPMSEQALLETIRLDIRVRAAAGYRILAVAPGNYGERFLRESAGLSMDQFVKCSNFVGDTFHMIRDEGIRRVLFAGHPGKLIKVAGGVLNTHSRYGDRRMEILAECAGETGAGQEEKNMLLSFNTTEEAAEYLNQKGISEKVFGKAARRVKKVLEDRYGVETEVILFSSVYGCLAQTDGAVKFVEELKKDPENGSGGHKEKQTAEDGQELF